MEQIGWTFSITAKIVHTCIARIFTRRKFSPISPPALIGEIIICEFFSCVKDYIADMATFTALVKILSLENFYNTDSWAWQKFCPTKFLVIWYLLAIA